MDRETMLRRFKEIGSRSALTSYILTVEKYTRLRGLWKAGRKLPKSLADGSDEFPSNYNCPSCEVHSSCYRYYNICTLRKEGCPTYYDNVIEGIEMNNRKLFINGCTGIIRILRGAIKNG